MPKINISKSVLIHAEVGRVFSILNDFHHWRAWSPWLIMEPEAKVDVAEDGKSYEWKGNRTGSGNMQVVSEEMNTSIDYDLTFLTPWKSTAKVRFELSQKDNDTQVTWIMDSSLPFFMFWMKKMMEAFVGMDYERGLALLKDYAEDGKVHSRLDFKGYEQYEGCRYIGLKTDCTIDTIGPAMEKDFEKLWSFAEGNKDQIAAQPFTIYHKWDVVKKKVSYTSGIPMKSIPEDLPEEMITGTIPATRVYTLAHHGPYDHLGNAWSTMYSMHRNKELKLNKKVHPFEVYVTDPSTSSGDDLITEIKFAVKQET